MRYLSCLPRVAIAVVGLAALAVTAQAEPSRAAKDIAFGKLLAENYCSQCHAIGPRGQSRFHAAPPFRLLSRRLDIDTLHKRFAEGISTAHPAMPHWTLDPDENRAMIAYIKSVQSPAPPP